MTTTIPHPKDQNVYEEEDAVNNKKAVGLMAQLTEISCSTDDYSYTSL